ncbi:ATP-binding protein [Streptomyces sp. TRM70350]|uniref:sensor histidine kinase n=1 Tax=Streptomyces sp. TRM70350 TaxID=2856165 RepID=UPI0027E1C8B7|nr:ATP-binding protein [Streptomyces sp. TRM70350]
MVATFRRQTLAGEMLVLQLAIVVVVLVAVAAVSLAQSEATFDRVEGRRVSALAEQLAANPLVRGQLVLPLPREALAPLVNATQSQSGVTSVTVADADGQIVSSTDPTAIGEALPLGDGAVEGRGWSGELTLDGGRERVAQVPVLGATRENLGRHLGTVMIGEASPTVWQRLSGASSYLLAYLGIASGLGLAGSLLLARRVKRQTLGLEPREIAGLAEHREAMLYGIAEGVVALDPQHRLTLVNEMGRRLLDLPEDCVGRSLADLGVEGRLRDVLAGDRDGAADKRDEVVIRHGRVLVMNRMTVRKDGRLLGSVTTLRDRTELARLEREIGSFRSSSELLRAQAHEFANQLHTISGLIQIGEQEEVVRYIRALNQRRQSLDITLSRRVRDTTVAALLMAKSSQAAERKVHLRISDNTALDRLTPEDAADVATVVGNLVDNAVDAAAVGGDVRPEGRGGSWRGSLRGGGGEDRRDGRRSAPDGDRRNGPTDGPGGNRHDSQPGGREDDRRDSQPGEHDDDQRDDQPGGPDEERRNTHTGGPGETRHDSQPGTPGETRHDSQPGTPGETRHDSQPGTPGETRHDSQPGTPGETRHDGRPGGRGTPRRGGRPSGPDQERRGGRTGGRDGGPGGGRRDGSRGAWVEVELRQDAASVEIAVRDSGPGVAPELAREVFSHGFTTKAAQNGERGIGLALTRLVCERHGGEISVSNTPDGALFTARMTVSHLTDAVAEGADR